jgi:hypothetical protein
MAGHNAPASGSTDAEFAAHMRTYRGFLLFMQVCLALTIVTLLALYFFLAR